MRAEALWRNASNQPAGRCPAAAGGPKQLVPSQKVSAAPPADDADLDAKLERILGSTGADNGSAGADNGSAGATGATQRYPLRGGTYPVQYAMELLNSHYFIGKSERQGAVIYRITDDGLATLTSDKEFRLDVAHIFVEIPAAVLTPGVHTSKAINKNMKLAQADQYWTKNNLRNEKTIVFNPDPNYTPSPGEFNLWRGFGVEQCKGWQKQRRLLRHILKVICRRDKAKFKYLIRWLAWAVQHPDEAASTVVVLKSRKEGTGKSTLGVVMQKLFGRHHSALVETSERLLSHFNAWQEPIAFFLGEEILWAGDRKTADQLKSRVTARTLQIEHKHGPVREIPNRLHIIMTSNHDHAIPAGVGARRFVVFEVSDEHARDETWFDPLYRDLENGGYEEFLWLLRNVKLGNWHPRAIIRTAETVEQQRMSADSITQWAQSCIDAGDVAGFPLPRAVASTQLQQLYTDFCQRHKLHPTSINGFGGACVEMFGPRVRLPKQMAGATTGNHRPWGYQVPDDNTWQMKVDCRLGIK